MFLPSVLLCGLYALALADVLPPTDGGLETASCPEFWDSYEAGCYKYVSSLLTWADAELHCQTMDAHLVSIHSINEMNFIVTMIENRDPTKGAHWIGFNDEHKEDSWMWSDGSRNDFTAWSPREPNNSDNNEDCAHVSFWDGMGDGRCSVLSSSVCKARKNC